MSASHPPTRRTVLGYGAAAAALAPLGCWAIDTESSQPKLRFGICDWHTGAGQSTKSFEFAREIGVEGVQVTFGKPGDKLDLRQPRARKAYAKVVRKTGVGFSSLAMGVLNSVPYSSDPNAEKWVIECVETMATMKKEAAAMDDPVLAAKMAPSVVLLAFFGRGDIKGKPALMARTVERLKKVAPAAEEAGVILGLETWLNARDHLRILRAVGSPAVQVYYDTANMTKMGYDIHAEIKSLGKRICQVHAKENGFLLGQGKVDFPKLKKTLQGIGYDDWLVIESSLPRRVDRLAAHTLNASYLKKTFREQKK